MKKSGSIFLISTFLSAILIGTLLLMLPVSSQGRAIGFENALFTSTSAVTVTGLIVVDTRHHFSFFGKMVILVLLQFGGLGFMTFSTLIILLVGKSISLTDKFRIENEFTFGQYRNITDLIKKIFLMTIGFETIGAIALFFQFPELAFKERIFSSVFHSISAFCNAGFSIFSNSFESYQSHIGINLTLMVLIFAGGIGFLVLSEIFSKARGKIRKKSRLSLHSKLVLIISLLLIVIGFGIILVEELINTSNTLPLKDKILTALFQSVTARTAGFNTINLNIFASASVFILLILMFIGASPGSTGGGVKTSSLGMVFAYFRSRLRNRENIDLFFRNIPARTIEKSFLVIFLALALVCLAFGLLLTIEKEFKLIELLFETISAFGTVGLSMGITARLSLASKLIIIVTMFVGRIGPLTILVALSRRESKADYQYPEENIMIG
jgi:trk system potassium uptake protein TrkH